MHLINGGAHRYVIHEAGFNPVVFKVAHCQHGDILGFFERIAVFTAIVVMVFLLLRFPFPTLFDGCAVAGVSPESFFLCSLFFGSNSSSCREHLFFTVIFRFVGIVNVHNSVVHEGDPAIVSFASRHCRLCLPVLVALNLTLRFPDKGFRMLLRCLMVITRYTITDLPFSPM